MCKTSMQKQPVISSSKRGGRLTMKAVGVDDSRMNPFLRGRSPRRILQKKEELSDAVPKRSSPVRRLDKMQSNILIIRHLNPSIHSATTLRNKNTTILLCLALVLSIFSSNVQGQPPPLPPAGFIDFDNLPVTRFSCEGKVIGGYYADVETGCQMFHVCTLGQKDEVQDIKFLCLNGTVFDQETRVCERVDEVDCSKAEEFFDLNLDLYVPHVVATPTPPELDLDQEDDFMRPVSTPKPPPPTTTTTTPRPTTTTKPTTTRPPSPKSASPSTKSPPTKGFSSFNYYLKTPHSHVASGYNSQSRQSYLINQSPGSEEKDSYTVDENTGRKIPSGPKTIVYSSPSSTTSTDRSRGPSRSTPSATPSPQPPPRNQQEEETEEQYADEYYDDELPLEYDMSSSTTGSSKQQNNYEAQQSQKNSYQQHQPQQRYQAKIGPSGYDYRDGRSAPLSSKNDRESKNSHSQDQPNKQSHYVSVAVTSSRSTNPPPTYSSNKYKPPPTPPKPSPPPVSSPLVGNSTEEPYYYDDDYPEDDGGPQPAVIVKGASGASGQSASTTTGRSAPSEKGGRQEDETIRISPTGPGETPLLEAEYYDDGDTVNVNEHHFSHFDVPRIPFAKPNVPRVLVTNGKPFLPRLRRQSAHHHYFPQQQQARGYLDDGRYPYQGHHQLQQQPKSYRNSFWDGVIEGSRRFRRSPASSKHFKYKMRRESKRNR